MAPRVSKNPEIRRAELVEAAARLFRAKGFEATSVDDIVREAKVAKGTFYYYFKTKDEVLGAVVDHISARSLEVVAPVMEDDSPGALERLRRLLAALRGHYLRHSDILDEMHGVLGQDAFHYRSQIGAVKMMAPVFAGVIRQGIGEGVFHTEWPEEVGEIVLLASNMLLDDAIFPAEEERMIRRIRAVQAMAEGALGVMPGTLYFISEWEEDQ